MAALLDALNGALHEHADATRPARRQAESLDPNRVLLAALFGLISAAVGAIMASAFGAAVATVSAIAMLIVAEKLSGGVA